MNDNRQQKFAPHLICKDFNLILKYLRLNSKENSSYLYKKERNIDAEIRKPTNKNEVET